MTQTEVVDKLIAILGLARDADLARALNADNDSILQWRKRKTLDKQTSAILLLISKIEELKGEKNDNVRK